MPTDQGNYIEYQCKKLYKGNNGLCAHQRFCQINDLPELKELFNNLLNINGLSTADDFIRKLDHLNITVKDPKTGINLSKTKEEWYSANEFLKASLSSLIDLEDIESTI